MTPNNEGNKEVVNNDGGLPGKPKFYTTSNGCPARKPETSLTASNMLLLRDFQLIDLLSHFNRERIPERVVHAKGAGAFGEFEVHLITKPKYFISPLTGCFSGHT
jgi:catalase